MNNILSTGKTKRLKEAKEEAQAEIEIFRKEQEKEFQEYQKDVCRSDTVENPLFLSGIVLIQQEGACLVPAGFG